jgi:hypothetical protein
MKLGELQVKLYNRNTYDYNEVFRGEPIHIKAGGYIVIDYEKANLFMGTMCSVKKDKGGKALPESFKKLEMDKEDRRRVELFLRDEKEEKARKTFVCHKCNEEFRSKASLVEHVKDEHLDDLADRKTREEVEEMENE